MEESRETVELGVRTLVRLIRFSARVGIEAAEADRLEARGMALAGRLGDPGSSSMMVLATGSLRLFAGDLPEALARYLEAARQSEEIDDPDLEVALQMVPPLLWSRLGPLADGLRWADRVVDLCGDNLDRGATVMGYSVLGALLNFRAQVLVRAGRLTDARADVERALSVDRPRADRESLCHALSLLPLLARLAGDDTDTTLSALEAAQIAEETGNVAFWVAALEGLGLAHLAAGRAAAAIEAFDKGLALSRERRSGLWLEASVLAHLALAHLAAGDQRAAIAAAGEAVEVSRRRSARVDECLALLTRGQVGRSSGGSAEVVGADLAAALTLAGEVGALTYEPFIREELGRLHADESELRGAVRLYTAIGATGHARRLAAELAGSGPRASAAPGKQALLE